MMMNDDDDAYNFNPFTLILTKPTKRVQFTQAVD